MEIKSVRLTFLSFFVFIISFLAVFQAKEASATALKLIQGDKALGTRAASNNPGDVPELKVIPAQNLAKFRLEDGKLKHPIQDLELAYLPGSYEVMGTPDLAFTSEGMPVKQLKVGDKFQLQIKHREGESCLQINGKKVEAKACDKSNSSQLFTSTELSKKETEQNSTEATKQPEPVSKTEDVKAFELFSGETRLEIYPNKLELVPNTSFKLGHSESGKASKQTQFRIVDGNLMPLTVNMPFPMQLARGSTVPGFNTFFSNSGDSPLFEARIEDGKLQLQINDEFKCVQLPKDAALSVIDCSSSEALKAVPIASEKPPVPKLVRTGNNYLNNEAVDKQILASGGSFEKYVESTEGEVRKKYPNLALREGETPKLDVTAIRKDDYKDQKSGLVFKFSSNFKIGFELPYNLTIEERARIYFRLLSTDMSQNKAIIISHGWNDKSNNRDFQKLAEISLLRDEEIIPFLVNWEQAAETKNTLAPDFQGLNLALGNNIAAAKAIYPTAQVLHKELEKMGVNLSNSYAIGHSLGTHIVTSIGSIGNTKFAKSILLDPPSSLNGEKVRYDIDGNLEGQQFPIDYNKGADLSMAFVGAKSIAGNQWVTTAHFNFIINLRGGIFEDVAGNEHTDVVRGYAQLIDGQKLVNNYLDLFSNSTVPLEKKGFGNHDGVIFSTNRYFELPGYATERKEDKDVTIRVPSIDFLAYKANGKYHLIGTNNSPEIAGKINWNRFYSDETLEGLPLEILGGGDKQTNCLLKDNKFLNFAKKYPAVTSKNDKVDMSNTQEARLCGFDDLEFGVADQIDEMIGTKKGKNIFVLAEKGKPFYSRFGDKEYAIIRNFKNGQDIIEVANKEHILTQIDGNVVKLTLNTRQGGLWWLITWAVGERSDLIAQIQFDTPEEAAKFSTDSLQEVQ
jgi:hypothetical protein